MAMFTLDRSSYVEFPFSVLPACVREDIIRDLNESYGEDAPDWSKQGEFTFGHAFGANQYNTLLWWGNIQYWHV